MKLLFTIHATVDDDPVKIQGIINVRSFDDPKIGEIYYRFFKDNPMFKANDSNVSHELCALCALDTLTSDQLDALKGNVIKYSKLKGITGKMCIIVPSLQYKGI